MVSKLGNCLCPNRLLLGGVTPLAPAHGRHTSDSTAHSQGLPRPLYASSLRSSSVTPFVLAQYNSHSVKLMACSLVNLRLCNPSWTTRKPSMLGITLLTDADSPFSCAHWSIRYRFHDSVDQRLPCSFDCLAIWLMMA